MVHSFSKEEEYMKGKAIFQGKKFTLSMCFCVRVVATQCNAINYSMVCYNANGLPCFFHYLNQKNNNNYG